jgi:GrpB-like predicted nucleotidyltransferase (UPF0157 family)/ubiquinone/menaquinone biosynthesis C-methylase UbiE
MITIVPYDPDWPRQFEQERARLADALGAIAIRIEHHGSTAVPGLDAKPVIDIQISVARLQPMDAYAAALARAGYTHLRHDDDAFAPFFHRPSDWPHTHHVHVVEAGSAEERKTLAFRDYLRSHPDSAQQYVQLKHGLAAQFGGVNAASREAYAAGKAGFVNALDVRAYYERYEEETRLAGGSSQLEFERTKEILARHLPPSPARVLDVGGAAGVYSLWLASLGHEVHLVDASGRLVEEAKRRSALAAKPIRSMRVGNACALDDPSESTDVVLVMGPLYHLTSAAEREAALAEAFRVLHYGGFVAVAAISRYASALDGLAHNLSLDPDFVAIRDQDLRDGQHRNPGNHPYYFTTAYFHMPDGLRDELAAAGFDEPRVLGVEGPGWLLSDFDERWADTAKRNVILDTARALEAEPAVIGASAHLLGLGWKKSVLP